MIYLKKFCSFYLFIDFVNHKSVWERNKKAQIEAPEDTERQKTKPSKGYVYSGRRMNKNNNKIYMSFMTR